MASISAEGFFVGPEKYETTAHHVDSVVFIMHKNGGKYYLYLRDQMPVAYERQYSRITHTRPKKFLFAMWLAARKAGALG